PGNTPDRYLKLYDRNTIPLRPNVFLDGKMAHDREWFLIYTNPDYWYRKWVKHEPPGPKDRVADAMDLRDLVAWYAALTTCLDDQVGRLLRALEENGLAEDTLVVFLSDHGDNLGSHHQWNKQLLIEESIRIPLIFRHPRGLPARVNAGHVASVIDVMPSLLDVCGLEIPAPVQGRSLRPLLEGKAGELDNNWACVETSAGLAGIRTPTHTYGIRFDAKTREITEDRFLFFDNAGDPYQFRNLAGTGEQGELGRVLRERVVGWHASTPWLDSLRSV
ncbi:MAG: sulfatase-like hydrolase/transferase, partial [Lentisphaerae bacterium]|nr:sulfatase-like hydrolase/transferase [Lentisphaerota bacterium]